ncbi:TRAP-type C4-dicarboxylate transport system, periplasmic component [hydrothermal vent metagenome]|uniref:TRAP-type C4-dicarboxylate transport system, periplasmic component n=1 Tax=hydrothermal vent metagenome TaxID=652676 RepID=A0A3B1DA54_9ZZZZ
MNCFNSKSHFSFSGKTRKAIFICKASVRKFSPFAVIFLWAMMLTVVAMGGVSFAGDKKTRIKFATLAPEGSSWMKEIRRLADAVEKKTKGRVTFKFYPGGVSGDEKDVIRKMRVGQIHAAGFTGVGLGQILPEVRVLDLPFLFETDEQVQHVYEKLNDYFYARFEEKGYILLGWVPVGWVHFFSTNKIVSVGDIKKTRPWMWEGDPLVEETYKALGVKPVPLSITDVLMSLQTGLLDTVYVSPQGALALQWFTKVKYMSRLKMGYATGAVLISKKKFDSLPADCKPVLKELSSKYLAQLVQTIQQDNAISIDILQDNGVQLIEMPDEKMIREFHQAGALARKNLVGKVFSAELLQTVLKHLRAVK